MMIVDAHNNLTVNSSERKAKEFLDFSLYDYLWPFVFMISAVMIGLNFPLGYLLMIVTLINRWHFDRYDFIIQFTLLSGGYSILVPFHDFGIPYNHLLLIACIILLFFYKKNAIEKKILTLLIIYIACLFGFAFLSDEELYVQFISIMGWISLIYFIVPLAAFGSQEFDIKIFFKHLFPYLFIFCLFYIIDGAILSGHFLIPRDAPIVLRNTYITFFDFSIHPFSFNIVRIWPQGLYIALICIYPLTRYYKFRLWQWILFIGALAITRTFTFIIAILFVWIICQAGKKKKLKIAGWSTLLIVLLFFVDTKPSLSPVDGDVHSALRIRSSIQQFIDLASVQDDEDLSKFGSNRMLNVIPAFDLLYNLNCQWTGLGFLSQSLTKNSKYVFVNDLSGTDEAREKVATGLEITVLQIIMTIGYLGLFIFALFYISLWLLVRKLKFSGFFGAPVLGFIVSGMGGFSGLIDSQGLFLVALALSAVLLANKSDQDKMFNNNLTSRHNLIA